MTPQKTPKPPPKKPLTHDEVIAELSRPLKPLTDEEILDEVYPIAHYDTDKERKLVEDSIKDAIRLARISQDQLSRAEERAKILTLIDTRLEKVPNKKSPSWNGLQAFIEDYLNRLKKEIEGIK